MPLNINFICVFIGLLCLAGCGKSPEQSSTTGIDYIEQSRGTVAALQQQLSTELISTIQTKGTVEAIEVCSNVAQAMTADVSAGTPSGQITRAALRVRNPANQADALSKEIMQDWLSSMDSSGQAPEPVVSHLDEQVIVHHPILLQAGCLACHGDPAEMSPEVSGKLAELYPTDEATGFAVGDLRGAFRVEFLTK